MIAVNKSYHGCVIYPYIAHSTSNRALFKIVIFNFIENLQAHYMDKNMKHVFREKILRFFSRNYTCGHLNYCIVESNGTKKFKRLILIINRRVIVRATFFVISCNLTTVNFMKKIAKFFREKRVLHVFIYKKCVYVNFQ